MFHCNCGRQDRKTLLELIKQWIEPRTTIVSDCWKVYSNLDKLGYIHKTVNHSVDLVNEEGYDTNKIEGHWQQLKVDILTHGPKKDNLFVKWWYIHRGEFVECIFGGH